MWEEPAAAGDSFSRAPLRGPLQWMGQGEPPCPCYPLHLWAVCSRKLLAPWQGIRTPMFLWGKGLLMAKGTSWFGFDENLKPQEVKAERSVRVWPLTSPQATLEASPSDSSLTGLGILPGVSTSQQSLHQLSRRAVASQINCLSPQALKIRLAECDCHGPLPWAS